MVGTVGRYRRSAVLASFVLLTLFVLGALPASANHWCGPATLTYSPIAGAVGETTTFSFTLTNNITDTLTVNNFYVTYSWSATQWDLGTATIPGMSSHTFHQTIVLPGTAGSYSISLSVNGIATGDLVSSTCSWQPAQFNVNSSILGGLGAVILLIIVAIAAVVAVVVIVVVVGARRRAPPPMPPLPPPQPPAR
jgi:hypothetical protein